MKNEKNIKLSFAVFAANHDISVNINIVQIKSEGWDTLSTAVLN